MQFIALTDIAQRYASHENTDELRNQFGGKALNLGILNHFGFQVPSGFVIPTQVFEEIMLSGLKKMPTATPQEVLQNIEFPPNFVDSLQNALQTLPTQQWAVRSSSTDEDSETHSFAGLQQSVIGISTLNDCLNAIRTVWMSFYARERLLYPTQNDLRAPVPSMAVIIQTYIDSETAGVIFTKHPLEGSQFVLINVSHGQGSNVVDGHASESLCISKSDVKSECEFDAHAECISASQINHLINTAILIETRFKHPQDIEFAFANDKLFILQTRDIANNHKNDQGTLYSNVNVGEALSGVATPMTWSLGMLIAQKGFECVFASFGLQVPENFEFVTTFNGHIYLNISQFLTVASQIPLIDQSIFCKVAGIHAPNEFPFSFEQMSRVHFIKNLPHSFKELLQIQKQISKLPQKAAQFEKNRDKLLQCDLSHASHEKTRQTFQQLNDLFFSCAFDMLTAGGSFLASYVLCSAFIGYFDKTETSELEQYMFSGLLDVQCAAPGLALLDIASAVHNYPKLVEAFIDEPKFDDLEAFEKKIQPIEGYQIFHTQLEHFIALYGARANQEAEIANPRWREDPRFLYRVIKAHLKSGIRNDAQNITETVVNDREKHTNEFRSMLSHTMRPLFRSLLGMAQKNARLRETWRSYVVDVLGIFRKYFLEVAEQWVENGILGHRDDIFFLTYEEFLNGLEHPDSLSKIRLDVAFRKARHDAYLSASGMPDTFVTHPNQCNDTDERADSHILYGIPASPGCVKAPVRVVHSLEEAADLEYGEILVTTTTDVGWTPLFLVASAILTERGGPLSHAFVVAREYGIPAVVSIPGLLNSLKTGDVVCVSGLDGTVKY